MKKIKSNNILLRFFTKSIASSLICIFLLSLISSEIILKLDISLDYVKCISVIIVAITSVIVGVISTFSFKNNGAIMGIISNIPIIFYCVCTLIFGENKIGIFLIKLCIIILLSTVCGFLSTNKKRKIKV